MIESCWAHLKRVTTKKGPLSSRKSAEEKWKQAWENLEQWRFSAGLNAYLIIFKKPFNAKVEMNYQEGHPARSEGPARQSKKERQKEIKKKMRLPKQIQQKTYPLFKQATRVSSLFAWFILWIPRY